ncbi:MAG: VOC family protein [Eubacterium sp.]
MKINRLDHLVLTTEDLAACLHFYVDILDMKSEESNGRYALRFGNQKINIHTRKAEFLPAAENPQYGSLDFCLIIDGSLEKARDEIRQKGWPLEMDIVKRHGAIGGMRSFYLRDPDGNLVEISSYC